MQVGRTVFAQVMEHFPAYEFQKCVTRYDGDFGKRSFSCLDPKDSARNPAECFDGWLTAKLA
jgi:Domain of unknown function (DUF4372)